MKTTALLGVLILLMVQSSAALDLRVNCGGSSCNSSDFGAAFVADTAFVGGEAYSTPYGWLLDDTADETLYSTGRSGQFSYRFKVANGWYIVRLGFCETRYHATGQRLFDVFCEGNQLFADLDILQYRRPLYPVVFSRAVHVADGKLNLNFTSEGDAVVSHISVISSEPDTVAPPAPSGFGVMGGFEASILSWDRTTDVQVCSHRIYRATWPDSDAVLLESLPYLAHWYSDESAAPGQTYGYRVTAVDVYGNESASTTLSWCTVLDYTSSQLPVYRLYVAPEYIQALNENPVTSTYYPAVLVVDGQSYDVQVHYRGSTSRFAPKKSWKIKLPSNEIVPGRDHVNLVGESATTCLILNVLGYAFFDSTTVPFHANAFKAHLEVNDQYMGLFTDVEEMDENFFAARGISPIGNLYDATSHFEIPDSTKWETLFEKMTNEGEGMEDVQEFVTYVNEASVVDFPAGILGYLNLDEFLDYYATHIMLMNPDFVSANMKIYHDPASGLWTFHPWDLDGGFWTSQMPINYGTLESPQPNGRHNILYTRVLDVPQFRLKYVDRLRHFATDVMTTGVWGSAIEDLFDSYVFDGDRDVWKHSGPDNTEFHQCPAAHIHILENRCAYVLGALDAYADAANGVFVNELMADNTSTIRDDHGDYDDWIEIHNIQDFPISLGDMYLTDDHTSPTKWALPDSVIPAGGYVIIWADNEGKEGPWHANFKLSAGGEEVFLYKDVGDSLAMLDGIVFGAQTPNISLARCPDGWVTWQLSHATPGYANVSASAPGLSQVSCIPTLPDSTEVVTVTVVAADPDGDLKRVTLEVAVDSAGAEYAMWDDGAHGDGQAGDGVYGAQFGPNACGTIVSYYVVAEDSLGLISRLPAGAPGETYLYRTCAVVPVLFVNEFMADNDSVVPDEQGEYEDWMEVFNPGPDSVSMLGLHLSDDFTNPGKWAFPDTTIGPGQFLLVWTDEDGDQGPLHANFKLSASGEQLGIFGSIYEGYAPVDTVTFGPQETDISVGRYPDGGTDWGVMSSPTPGSANSCASGTPPGAVVERTDLGVPAPNPFADAVLISFDVRPGSHARLAVYDVSGRVVRLLREVPVGAGSYQVTWDGKDSLGRPVASGIYFAVLDSENATRSRKIVCLR